MGINFLTGRIMERTKWTDRKFTFDFPEGWIFNILERLSGTPARIRSMIAGLSEEVTCFQPDGKWSIKEHIGHLNDLEALHEGRLEDFKAGKDILRAADMANIQTNAAHHNERTIDELLEKFTSSRVQFVDHLKNLKDTIQYRQSLHPRLQVMMRPVDMAYFTAEHDDHHLASIRELMIRQAKGV
jgi:hypothetical protein